MQAWAGPLGFTGRRGEGLRHVDAHRHHGQTEAETEPHRVHERVAEFVEGIAGIRKRGDRPQHPIIPSGGGGLFPHLTYSHLVLQDYLSQNIPDPMVVNPDDVHRTKWARDPLGYDQGLYQPSLGNSVAPSVLWRHPYGASFRVCAASIKSCGP